MKKLYNHPDIAARLAEAAALGVPKQRVAEALMKVVSKATAYRWLTNYMEAE